MKQYFLTHKAAVSLIQKNKFYLSQVLLLIGIFTQLNIAAQTSPSDSSPVSRKKLKTIITTIDKKEYTAFLVNITDTSLQTYSEPVRFSTQLPANLTTNYSYSTINTMKVWRKGRIGRGILWGALSGAVIGVAAGFIEGDDKPQSNAFFGDLFTYTADQKALGYGTALAITGGLVGAIIGAVAKKKFIIHGKKENLKAMQQSLLNKGEAVIRN